MPFCRMSPSVTYLETRSHSVVGTGLSRLPHSPWHPSASTATPDQSPASLSYAASRPPPGRTAAIDRGLPSSQKPSKPRRSSSSFPKTTAAYNLDYTRPPRYNSTTSEKTVQIDQKTTTHGPFRLPRK